MRQSSSVQTRNLCRLTSHSLSDTAYHIPHRFFFDLLHVELNGEDCKDEQTDPTHKLSGILSLFLKYSAAHFARKIFIINN